jgi:two-component system, cell cycle sensor histidine kinase and response regulator CckA
MPIRRYVISWSAHYRIEPFLFLEQGYIIMQNDFACQRPQVPESQTIPPQDAEHRKKTDSAKESEKKYRALVENSIQGLAVIQDGRFVFCNSALAAMTGYSVEELLTFPNADLLMHPDDRHAIEQRRQDRMAGKTVPALHEHRVVKKDGTVCWMEICSSLIELNGRTALQVANIDVTSRKHAEEALRRSEKLLSDILDGSPIPQLVIDRNHRIVNWNKALERYSGIRAEEVIGTDQQWRPFYREKRPLLADLLVDGDTGKISQFYTKEYATSNLVEGAYEVIDFFPAMGGNGKWLHVTASAIKDSRGAIVGAIETLRDISEWRQTEEELKESREYLNQIINCIGDPLFVKDRNHKIVLVNQALCVFTGKPREALLGRTHLESLPEASGQSLWEREEEVFTTGKECLTEDTLSDSQGNAHTLMSKKSLLTDKNGNQQIVNVLRDITEHKLLEAQFLQAHKMEAVGALAGGVAHDFNNILNVIMGYAEILLDEFDSKNPMRKDLEQIRQAGLRAASLITQLLAFSRKQILQPEILDLNTVITNTSSMLRRLIGEDIELISNTCPDLGMVNADPGKIQQVIMNLAINARDAMPQGGTLILETANVDFDESYILEHPIAKPGSFVMLAVSDSGIGMDAKIQARIFDPFFTTKELGKGTGLGLSTVYGIVKQSDGFIWVYSEPGKGATFKIYLPRVEGRAVEKPVEKRTEYGIRGSETILVVEDEESVRDLACRILQDRGYTVLSAPNGKAGLEIASRFDGAIDMVLTDVVMPGMSGTDFVFRLKQDRPDTKVLYFSGYTNNAIIRNGNLDSKAAFLQKPFNNEDLAQKVRQIIESKHDGI